MTSPLLTPEHISALEEKAKAATPGPWEAEREDDYRAFITGGASAGLLATVGNWAYPVGEDIRNADFMAAANPAVVLALIERLKAAEEKVAAAKKAWSDQGAHLEHAVRCETSRQHYGARAKGWPDLNDPRCDCGARELVLALEAL